MKTYFETVPIEAAHRAAHLDAEDRHRPIVLVVDGDPLITFTLEEILKQSGYAAIAACSSAEALETAMLIPPDVLIANSSMRGTSGLELASEVRQVSPECELILIAGNAVTADQLLMVHMRAEDLAILSRPVHPRELLACIAQCLAKKRPAGSCGPFADGAASTSTGDSFASA
jgi:DNA-binding response OmpR family regulator